MSILLVNLLIRAKETLGMLTTIALRLRLIETDQEDLSETKGRLKD